KGQSEDALHALERIHGTVPEGIKDDIEFLRANVYLALGRPADAVEVLRRLQGTESLKGFAAYNLGIALLQADHTPDALRQLDKAGQIERSEEHTSELQSRGHLVCRLLLEKKKTSRLEPSGCRTPPTPTSPLAGWPRAG